MSAYYDFLAAKVTPPPAAGFTIDPADLHPSLSPFQRAVVTWCLRQGRAALFEDTGLGKSRQKKLGLSLSQQSMFDAADTEAVAA